MARVIPSTWEGVPQVIIDRFGSQAGKQRAMFHDGHLVLVTHMVPGPEELDRKAAIFWRHPTGTWKATGAIKGGLNALKELVGAYRERVHQLEDDSDNAKRAADYFRVLNEVSPILRSVRHLHKALQEAREAVPKDTDIITLRDAAAEVERTAELVQHETQAGIDFLTAKRAEEQAELSENIARSSHRLNLIAALFLPVTAIGSVFGANLTHGLETTGAPWLFWGFIVCAFMIGFFVRASISGKGLPKT